MRKHAVHIATCTASIAFALTLALPAFVSIPLLWYRPVEREWLFAVHAGGIAIDFYGRCLFASIVAVAAAAISYVIVARANREPSRRIIAVFTVWAISITMLVLTFYAWRLAHREIAPHPLPSWYQPR